MRFSTDQMHQRHRIDLVERHIDTDRYSSKKHADKERVKIVKRFMPEVSCRRVACKIGGENSEYAERGQQIPKTVEFGEIDLHLFPYLNVMTA